MMGVDDQGGAKSQGVKLPNDGVIRLRRGVVSVPDSLLALEKR